MERIFPYALQKGDTIGLIAPCYAMSRERLQKPVETLEKLGYRIRFGKYLFSQSEGYAGTVQERAEDFNAMIMDRGVKAVLFDGGEVGNEILPYIDYETIIKMPKIICSYSDGTSILNAVTSRTGLVTFYGVSPLTFDAADPYNLRAFEKRLCTGELSYEKSGEWTMIHPGKCRGRLTGGYLINYANLYGSPYIQRRENKPYVLFVEDSIIFSQPAMVSKWFSNLEMYGAFENVKGLIWGHYADQEYHAVDVILRRLGEKYQIPVVRCEDYGHGRYNAVLPIGVECALDTYNGVFELLEPAVLLRA